MKKKAERILKMLDERAVEYCIDETSKVILKNEEKDEQIENFQKDISNNSALETAIFELITETFK